MKKQEKNMIIGGALILGAYWFWKKQQESEMGFYGASRLPKDSNAALFRHQGHLSRRVARLEKKLGYPAYGRDIPNPYDSDPPGWAVSNYAGF